MTHANTRSYSPAEVAACVVAKCALAGTFGPRARWPERVEHYVGWLLELHADQIRETDPRGPVDQLREILGAVPKPPTLEMIR